MSMTNMPRPEPSEPVRIEDHLGLVRSLVLKFIRKGDVEDSELYSVGCIALLEAAKTFDPSKSKFCTWAWHVVMSRLIDEVKKNGRATPSVSCDFSNVAESRKESVPLEILPDILISAAEDDEDKDATKMLFGHYLDGKSLAELGKEFGYSKEWVRKRVQLAVMRIRLKNRHILENHL